MINKYVNKSVYSVISVYNLTEMEEILNEIYQLETDDDYFKCCGEIFVTIKGLIVFHCSLCELKCKGFKRYCEHLRRTHFLKFEECSEQNRHELNILESCSTDSDANENECIEIIEIEPTHGVKIKHELLSDDDTASIEVLEEDAFLIKELLTADKQKSLEKCALRVRSQRRGTFTKPQLTNNERRSKNKTKAPTCKAHLEDGPLINAHSCHELPSCDRPMLKPSRKPASSLTDEERKHKCPYCPFASKDKTNLWSHIHRHSNNKPHQCSYCPKNFHTRVELTFHTRYHTGERPFLCSECGRSFVTKEHLKQHVKRHKNQRDYKCADCNKGFFSSQEVLEHRTVHTKETPFKCDLCDRVFTRKKALMAHNKLHENKRSYKCKFCNVGFNQSAGLYLHMKTKHQASQRAEVANVNLAIQEHH